ncbi:hypothetical protein D3C84_365120 [compost metagenome]
MILADAEAAEREKTAVRQGIGVEQQLFGALIDIERTVGRARATVVARVFVTGGGALIVQPGTPGRRQRQVGLADATLDLLKQRLAQLALPGQFGFQVGVFRLEVFEHLLGVALLQPGVRVGSVLGAGDGGVRHLVTPIRHAQTPMSLSGHGKAVIISPSSSADRRKMHCPGNRVTPGKRISTVRQTVMSGIPAL